MEQVSQENNVSKTGRLSISPQTRTNWIIDVALFLGAVGAMLTGVYFLFLPSGGYQGGRNPFFGVTILFSRQTWSDLHTWAGVLVIVAAVVHFSIHWQWVKTMSRRVFNSIRARSGGLSKGSRVNVLIDAIIALSFLATAISGVYFLLMTSGGYEGGRNAAYDPGFLFPRTTWDAVHTWAGVVMIVAAVIHFAIHWRWVKNVTARFALSLWQRPKMAKEATAVR